MKASKVHEVTEKRILTFLREKDTDVKKLQTDLYYILDEAFKKGDLPYRMIANVEIVGEKLVVEYEPADKFGEEFDLNGDYKDVGPDPEEWPESVVTYPPIPMEKFNEIMEAAVANFEKKLGPGMYLIVPEGITEEEARKQREEDVDRWYAELVDEINKQLPFEMEQTWKGIYPKNPYKEINGCIVVRK